MLTVTRRLEFDYGHRVLRHEGKCARIHGHRGAALVTVKGPGLDAVDRVIDFGVVKQILGGWIDDNWDHNLLLNADDPLLEYVDPATFAGLAVYGGKAPYVMNGNPTAENMAVELFGVAADLLPDSITVVAIKIFETPNCCADYDGT